MFSQDFSNIFMLTFSHEYCKYIFNLTKTVSMITMPMFYLFVILCLISDSFLCISGDTEFRRGGNTGW